MTQINPKTKTIPSFHTSIPLAMKESAKITSISNKNRYPELTQFRQNLQEAGVEPNYHLEKHAKRAQLYRIIFLSLSGLFLALFSVILAQNATALYSLFFGSRVLAKLIPCLFCGVFSVASFLIYYGIQVEKEAIHHSFRRFKSKLHRAYKQRRAKLGWRHFLAYFHLDQRATAEYIAFHEALDKMQESRDMALGLIDQIRSKKREDLESYEQLCNQAVAVMRDQVHAIIRSYSQHA